MGRCPTGAWGARAPPSHRPTTHAVPKEVVDERLQRGPVHRGEGAQEPPVLADLCLLVLQRCERSTREEMSTEGHEVEIKTHSPTIPSLDPTWDPSAPLWG